MARDMLQDNLDALREFVHSQGWEIVAEKVIDYGRQFTVSNGFTTTPVILYRTGTIQVQGKPGQLRDELRTWGAKQRGTEENGKTSPKIFTPSLFATDQASTAIDSDIAMTPASMRARIGSDEAGKGDYFGPLVVAAIYVDETTEPQLRELGVRDSKLLAERRLLDLAQEIKKLCSGRGTILTYMPEDYNKQYQTITNLNRLLARAHVQVLQRVAVLVDCELAIVDQFGDPSLMQEAARQASLQIQIEQRVRAESDMAVAAASILARAEFVQRLAALSRQTGIELPKGASDPRIVEIGHQIVARGGTEALGKVAKLHFQTTATILAGR